MWAEMYWRCTCQAKVNGEDQRGLIRIYMNEDMQYVGAREVELFARRIRCGNPLIGKPKEEACTLAGVSLKASRMPTPE